MNLRAPHASLGRAMLVAVLVAIGANALLYACKTANPLIGADGWYFVDTTVRNAAEGHLGLGDLFAKHSALDHSQPLRKLILLFHYRFFDLDFSVEAIVGVLAAFANLGIMWRIVRPGQRKGNQAVAGCVFAAITAVYLSLNASVVFDWPLLTLAFTGHAFLLCFLLACWWAFHRVDARRLALLAVAALAMDVVVDDTGLVATIAAILAVVFAGWRQGDWRRAWPVVLTISAAYLAYALGRHWTIDSAAASAGPPQVDLGTLLRSLWRHMDTAQSGLLAPFLSAVVHPVQLSALLGQRAPAAGIAIGLAIIGAHGWFWWCAWRGRHDRAAFVAIALMLLFYGLVAGILVVRVGMHTLAYLWQPRYVVIYQWNVLALLLMGVSQLAGTDTAKTSRRTAWPAAALACAAIALIALQFPLSQHSWSGVRYRNANQQRAALALGALARRPAPRAPSPEGSRDCRVHLQCRSEVARFMKAHRLNIFSPAFQARNRLYPDARALGRLGATHGRADDRTFEPVIDSDP